MVFVGVWLVCVAASALSFPIERKSLRGSPLVPTVQAIDFMKKYGYLQESTIESEALFTETGLSEVIKLVQKFGAIPQTGEFDNATLQLMTAPRCGLPDVISAGREKRFVLGPSGWNKRNITFFIANWPATLSEFEVTKYITLALDTWGRYGRLKFSRAPYQEADIIVAFGSGHHGDRYPFDGPGNVLAHAYFPYEMERLGGDIHFDGDEKWITKEHTDTDEGIDFLTVAVHELGHSLGLSHSHVQTSVMFPYYLGGDDPLVLDYDDILGMYELYIRRRLSEDDIVVETVPTTSTTDVYSYYTNEVSTTSITITPSEISTTTDATDTSPSTSVASIGSNPKNSSPTTGEGRESTTQSSVATEESNTPTRGSHIENNLPTTAPDTEDNTEINLSTTTQSSLFTTVTYKEHTNSFTTQTSVTYKQGTSTVSYEGDFETVDDHKTHDPKHRVPSTNSPSLPDVCSGKYDAIATIRNEIFIFMGQYIWRLRKVFDIVPGYPVKIQQMFPKFPKEVKSIDAAYETPDGMVILFTGNHFWITDGTNLLGYEPKSITEYGLPGYVDKIDAVQTWAKNGKTYFYSGTYFWRYNEETKTMDPGYPKHMERWRGVPADIDAATTWKGTTYFFKDRCYWKFDNDWIIITDSSPLPTPQTWLGCPKETVEYCIPSSLLATENDYEN